jgi:hypothetical protein
MISARKIAMSGLCSLCPLPAAALCVTNGTDDTLFFTVEAAETGGREGKQLGPDETFCIEGSHSGVVAAFDTADSLEGCSRLATQGDRLLAFARFDRCTWVSHFEGSLPADD